MLVFNLRNFARSLFVIAVSGWLLAGCGGSDRDATVVGTDKGSLRGVETASARQFLGIPYAAPPTGSARWVSPQAAATWSGVRDASQFGPHCPQPDTAFGRASNTSEDCLYLNVYRPKDDGAFPVMVWIHGGALFLGESDDYDPSQLVGQGVVVVTLNYRLGALGFLAHASLSAEASGPSGNYGIMDQQAALRWVQTNIAAFGGDPKNVTIFGESAGGHSVHTHLASSLSAGLFHKAIIESGSYSLDTPSLPTAQALGQNFAVAAGCTDQTAACLRSLPLAQVLAKQSAIITGAGVLATVDNKVLTRTHRTAFATGAFSHVPVVEGSNGHEFSLITAFYFDFTAPPTGLGPVTADNYPTAESLILSFYDAHKAPVDVDAVYPVASFPAPVDAIDAIGTDSAYSCPARNSVQAMSNYTTVFQYEFNDPNAPMIYLPASPSHPTWGAYHASEMQYLFKVAPSIPSPPAFDPAQQALSTKMIGFWAQFAKTGNPNATGSSLWPQYIAATDTAMSLDPTGVKTTTDFAARHRCMFWTGL